jgi:hypothetical protein
MQNTLSPSLRAARVQAITAPYYAVEARSSQISCLHSHGPASICCTALRTGLDEGWPTWRHGRPASRPAQSAGPCFGLLRKATCCSTLEASAIAASAATLSQPRHDMARIMMRFRSYACNTTCCWRAADMLTTRTAAGARILHRQLRDTTHAVLLGNELDTAQLAARWTHRNNSASVRSASLLLPRTPLCRKGMRCTRRPQAAVRRGTSNQLGGGTALQALWDATARPPYLTCCLPRGSAGRAAP